MIRGAISLYDCLDEFVEPERMEKCGFKCEKCKAVDRMDKDMTIFRFPKILVIHLKRFRNRQKVSTGIDIPRRLDVSKYAPYSGKQLFNLNVWILIFKY
jgi:ubiquitin C-terminal hydrolase